MKAHKNRSISQLLYAQIVDMGGFPVRQPLPSRKVDMIDPFLLLHHAEVKYSENTDLKNAGVGPHPHRGFSPATFVFKGGVHHRDSRGNDSIIYEGGTQWMNAGMGIIHSERPPENINELGGTQEIIQLWINTPRNFKMDEPAYYGVTSEETPYVSIEDPGKAGMKIQVVTGEYKGVKGPVPAQSEILALRMSSESSAKYFFELPEEYNAFLYALDGQLRLGQNFTMDGKNMAVLTPDGMGIEVEVLDNSRFIIMAGKPLDEPVETYGPFVMSNQTEIQEAMRDYQMGKMGVLVEK